MITKAELEKMVEDGAEKKYPDTDNHWHQIALNGFKSGAAFVTGILMPEIEKLEKEIDRVIDVADGNSRACIIAVEELSEANATIQSLKDENGRIDQQRELLEKALIRVLSQPFKGDWDVQAVYIQHMLHEARNWKALTQKAEELDKCPPHSWDASGERCTKCGDKDWMT